MSAENNAKRAAVDAAMRISVERICAAAGFADPGANAAPDVIILVGGAAMADAGVVRYLTNLLYTTDARRLLGAGLQLSVHAGSVSEDGVKTALPDEQPAAPSQH